MLLINRKMPKSCIDCVCNNDNYWCNMTGDELDYDIAWTGRMPNCPLKEEERKTGKWIQETMHYKDAEQEFCYYEEHCSICGVKRKIGWGYASFCPNCGARMEGEEHGRE